MYDFPERTLIRAVGVGRIKTTKAAAAQTPAAVIVQRVAGFERRSATAAEEFGVERLRFPQAAGADRDAGNSFESAAADAAIVGKEQGKKGVRGCTDC
jgi:hypothetical protein